MNHFATNVRRFRIIFYLGLSLTGLGALFVIGLFFIAVRNWGSRARFQSPFREMGTQR